MNTFGPTGTEPPRVRGLEQCARCQGIFPRAEMNPGQAGFRCMACHVAAQTSSAGDAAEGVGVRTMSPLKRQAYFAKFAELRRQIDAGDGSVELIFESAKTAEILGLTLEAIDAYRHVVELQPENHEAEARMKALRRQAAATGETGARVEVELPRRRTIDEDRPFWSDLGGILAYPFVGKGGSVLLAASIFFAVADVIAQVNVIGWLVFMCMWGYVACYQFDVIGCSSAGKKEPPEFPEVLSLLDSMIFPYFAWLGCVVFAFLPCIAMGALTVSKLLPPIVGVPLILVTFALGFFLFPMTLMIRGLLKDVLPAANPSFVLGSVGRIFPDYLAAFCAIAIVWVFYAVASGVVLLVMTMVFGPPTADALLNADWVRVFGWLLRTAISWPMLLYCLVVQSNILGRLYRQGSQRLAWFHAPTAATQKAKKMSIALFAAALGCGLLVMGGGWIGYQVYKRAGPGMTLMAESCPIRDGARLTYFFESTDGPAGLVSYRFKKRSDGLFEVSMQTWMAGTDRSEAYGRHMGVFDPDVAMWMEAKGGWIGESGLPAKVGEHVPFYGPRSASVGRSHINGWTTRGEQTWEDTWDVWRVLDNNATEFHFDEESGVLVGRRFRGIGFEIREWLVSHQGVKGVGACPPANRGDLLAKDF